MNPISAQLAEFVVARAFADISLDVVDRAKMALLDQLGCELVGSTLAWNQPAYGLATGTGGKPESSVVGRETRVPAFQAAYVNAAFGHGAELDDYGSASGAHSGSVVVPTAMALAEMRHLDGKALLTAVVVGYDVAWSLGKLMRLALHRRGYHTHAVISVFCAAAVAGKVMGLERTKLSHAFAIAGSYAGGTMEYDQSGGEVKRVHSGIAAQGGVQSATLAGLGLTGPSSIFEGSRGIFRVLAGLEAEPIPTLDLVPGMGLSQNGLKQFPTTASQHAPIEMLADLMASEGFTSGDVERIEVDMDRMLIEHVGTILEPHEVIQAQFSLPFSLALRLVKGRNHLDDYVDQSAWEDPIVLAAARKVHLIPDPETNGEKYSYKMRVKLNGHPAELKSSARYPRGHHTNPFTRLEVQDKFRTLAAKVLPSSRIEEVIETIDHLEEVPDVSDLADLVSV